MKMVEAYMADDGSVHETKEQAVARELTAHFEVLATDGHIATHQLANALAAAENRQARHTLITLLKQLG